MSHDHELPVEIDIAEFLVTLCPRCLDDLTPGHDCSNRHIVSVSWEPGVNDHLFTDFFARQQIADEVPS